MKKFKPALLLLSAAFLAFGLSACSPAPEAHEHSLTPVAATASTCSERGAAAHYACRGCDKLFSDGDGTHEVTQEQLALPLAQHSYKDVKKDASGHWLICEVCSEPTEKVRHDYEAVTYREASATRDGYSGSGHVCKECGLSNDGVTVTPKTTVFKSETYDGLNYCSYMPAGTDKDREKLPLVIFLHGSGERGSDNAAQLKNAVRQVVYRGSESAFMNSVFLVPQCPADEMWSETPWENGNYNLADVPESEVNKKVVALVRHYISEGYADADRIYVIGISMGGFGTWDLLARHSDIFAAGVPVCGGAPADAVGALKNVPVYTFHSVNDLSVPYAGTKEIVDAIKAAGGDKINFVSYENDGHMIWDKAITYEGLEEWLFAQKLSR